MDATATTAGIAEAADQKARVLERRAAELRGKAELLPPPLAAAYRRRASELELEAFLVNARFNPRAVATPVAA